MPRPPCHPLWACLQAGNPGDQLPICSKSGGSNVNQQELQQETVSSIMKTNVALQNGLRQKHGQAFQEIPEFVYKFPAAVTKLC